MYDNVIMMSLKKKETNKKRKRKKENLNQGLNCARYIHPRYKPISSFVQVLELQIGQFSVVGLVPLPLSECEAKVELVLVQTSFL